ncbi:MAG: hypothetical protein ACKO3R_04395 [bacterium]
MLNATLSFNNSASNNDRSVRVISGDAENAENGVRQQCLETYIKTLSGKTVSDLEQSPELREFVKKYQSEYGFHLHLKNGDELDPCDGDHHHKPSTDKLKSLHKDKKHSHNHDTSKTQEHKHYTQHPHAHEEHTHEAHAHNHTHTKHHKHNHDHEETKKGFLEKLISNISENESIPKALKPILARATINTTNIFLAQGLSLPLHHIHSPNEITNGSAVAAMHLLNYGTQKWENLAKNLLTIIPFVALHRVVKVPSFVMRSALGLAISLGEQLTHGDKSKNILDKIKETFTKDASKFLVKLAQMETMLNTAIPLGQAIAKNVPNKALAFISQNLAMAGAFTLIPELFKAFRKDTDKSNADLNHTALSAELLECPVCGEAHAADVHLAEISEGVSIAGANNASEQDNLHSLVHHGGLH